MKVFAVMEIETNPHGESMGYGHTYKLFTTKEAATEYKKMLVRKFTAGPERRPRLGMFTVRAMTVEE